MGAMTLFTRVVNQFKRMASGLKETPKAAIDDFELEHFLIYHGLVGTSPENQRDFRDVRADILEALNAGSALQLAIALKLPPLWWNEKLAAIVLELSNEPGKKQDLIDLLLPKDENDIDTNVVPVCNSDWRVRANAAGILADLDCKQASHILGNLLNDTTYDGKVSFAHISYALGRLRTDEARLLLLPHLYSEEPWLRVDTARALSLWPSAIVLPDLAKALLAKHALQDYLCITVARQHKPAEFLANKDATIFEAGLEMVIQIIEGTTQTFNNDVGFDLGLVDCWPFLNKGIGSVAPRQIRATLMLANWLKKNQEQLDEPNLESQIQTILDSFADKSTAETIVSYLNKDNSSDDNALGQMRHAANLAGKLGIVDASANLERHLDVDSPIINEAINALSLLRDKQSVAKLIALANRLVDLDERTSRTLSAQPVVEEDAKAAETYWTILSALGSMPGKDSFEFLRKASSDYAADKRQMALESLLSVITAEPQLMSAEEQTHWAEQLMSDPAPGIRVVAYKAVGELGLASLINKVLSALSQAKEPSVKRQARATLLQLAAKGQRQAVCHALEQKLKTVFDPYQRQDLEKLLSSAR